MSSDRGQTMVVIGVFPLFLWAQMTPGQVAETETRERNLKILWPADLT